MKKIILVFVAVAMTPLLIHAKARKEKTHVYNFIVKSMEEDAFEIISRRIGVSEFKPGSHEDVTRLRSEASGMIDFLFVSKNGKFTGDAFCDFQELLGYHKDKSDPYKVCPRINVHDTDPDGLNGIGKQVGIY